MYPKKKKFCSKILSGGGLTPSNSTTNKNELVQLN